MDVFEFLGLAIVPVSLAMILFLIRLKNAQSRFIVHTLFGLSYILCSVLLNSDSVDLDGFMAILTFTVGAGFHLLILFISSVVLLYRKNKI